VATSEEYSLFLVVVFEVDGRIRNSLMDSFFTNFDVLMKRDTRTRFYFVVQSIRWKFIKKNVFILVRLRFAWFGDALWNRRRLLLRL
jgi:hypothetical protein